MRTRGNGTRESAAFVRAVSGCSLLSTAIGFPIYWRSQLQNRKATSTPGAETIALRAGSAATKYVAGFLIEVGAYKNSSTPTLHSDAKDVVSNTHTMRTPVESNLQGDFSGLRQDQRDGILKFKHVSASYNYADLHTKKGASSDFYLKAIKEGRVTFQPKEMDLRFG